MFTKFVIFVAVSAFLVTAIYSSSFTVFATIACAKLTNDPNSYTCTNSKTKEITLCTKTKKGWDCQYLTDRIDTNIPPALRDAIDAAIQESPNATKGPKPDLLDDGATTFGDAGDVIIHGGEGSDVIREGNSSDTGKDTKVPKIPEDLGGSQDEQKDESPTINPELPK